MTRQPFNDPAVNDRRLAEIRARIVKRRERIAYLHGLGVPKARIARDLGVSHTTVDTDLKALKP
jgi:DNA-binding NarL/FixJ family response regulator